MRLPTAAILLFPLWSVWASPESAVQGSREEIRIRGRIVCLSASGPAVPERDCSPSPGDFALRTQGGKLYRFRASDAKTEMFLDTRVRERELEVVVWLEPPDQVEIIKVYSVRDGKLHDVYYYCEVCLITAYGGGPCWCCQEEFEFREVPLS